MIRDRFIEELPFFADEHRRLATSVANFVAREVEARARREEEGDTDEHFREMLGLLAEAGLLRFAVARAPDARDGGDAGARAHEAGRDVRSLCIVREALSYSSSLADLAFVMQ